MSNTEDVNMDQNNEMNNMIKLLFNNKNSQNNKNNIFGSGSLSKLFVNVGGHESTEDHQKSERGGNEQIDGTDLIMFEEFNDEFYVDKNTGGYGSDGFDSDGEYYGGATDKIPKVTTAMDNLFKRPKPYIRNFTRGKLTSLTPEGKKGTVLAAIFNLTQDSIENDKDFQNKIKEGQWIGLFYKKTNSLFAPINSTKKSFFKPGTRLAVVTFNLPSTLKYFKEEFDKTQEPEEIKNKTVVMMKVKGFDLIISKTDHLVVDKVHKINSDNTLSIVKGFKDVTDVTPKSHDDISKIFKNMTDLCTDFS